MKVNIMAFLIGVAIIILSLLGVGFACGLGYFVWSDEEFGVIRRIAITLITVVPVAIVSMGFFVSAVVDLAALITGKSKGEKEDAEGSEV